MEQIQEFSGVFLPAHETHLIEWMRKVNHRVDGKLTYQYSKFEAAMKHVKQFRGAIDVGAHCGLWSMHLVERFKELWAFEPVALHRLCFRKNVALPYQLIGCALGEKPGSVKIHTSHTSSGDSWVDGDGDIPMRTLDSLHFDGPIDFIKLDCEGYELFALRGGEQLLIRHHPCVLVEQKPGRAQKYGLPETGAVDYLRGLGAKLRFEKSGDYCLSWD
jgi:FkbM family methyltransferase